MFATTLSIVELPSPDWDLSPTMTLQVDRGGQDVRSYLETRGVRWQQGAGNADVYVYKPPVGRSFRNLPQMLRWLWAARTPVVTLIGEPPENCLAYAFASPRSTLAVAPGRRFRPLYYASEWIDPGIEDWGKRLDEVVWIGRPTTDRVRVAQTLENAGVPLAIYSRDIWPSSSWRGYASDEIVVSKRYKWRLVSESSQRDGCHTEKLFNAIRCGCIPIYLGDPHAPPPQTKGTFLPYSVDALVRRHELAESTLAELAGFMHSARWEVYSFRAFYDRIIDCARSLTV